MTTCSVLSGVGLVVLAIATLSGCAGHAPSRIRVVSAREAPIRAVTPVTEMASQPAPTAAIAVDPDVRTIRELRRASDLFETFVAKAGPDPRFADAVGRSRQRMSDIAATIAFLEEGLRERGHPVGR